MVRHYSHGITICDNRRWMCKNGDTMAVMSDHSPLVHCLVRDYNWQVLKHCQGGILHCPPGNDEFNYPMFCSAARGRKLTYLFYWIVFPVFMIFFSPPVQLNDRPIYIAFCLSDRLSVTRQNYWTIRTWYNSIYNALPVGLFLHAGT